MIKRGISALDVLVCTSCTSDLFESVYMCNKGHSFCEACYNEDVNCLICKGIILSIRNRVIEELTNEIPIPCKWKKCKEAHTCREIVNHERNCRHKAIQCSLCLGFISFHPNEIVKHVESAHNLKFEEKADNSVKIEGGKKKRKSVYAVKLNDTYVLVRIRKYENHSYVTFQTLDSKKRDIRVTNFKKDSFTTILGGEPHLISHGSSDEALNVIIRLQ